MKTKVLKILIVSIIAAVVVGGSIAGIVTVNRENKKEKLVIYNWADYINTDNLELFKEYYKAKTGNEISVVYSMFDTNETMMTEIIKGDSQIDLICPSEYAIEKLMKKGLLQKLDMSSSEYEYVDNVYPAIRERVDAVFPKDGDGAGMNDYFVPYMWGTLGILYNAEKVTEDDLATGWGLLWNKNGNPDLEGKILMKDSVRDVYVATVVYLKDEGLLDGTEYESLSIEELINTVDDNLLKMCESVLMEQRKHLKGYEVDFGKDDMINEAAYVDLAWSGDALYAIEESYDEATDSYKLDYFVPGDSGNIWFDGWAIPTTAQNVSAAKEFINFMCRPDVAMRNMMEIGYTCSYNPVSFYDSHDEFTQEAIACLVENEYAYEISAEEMAEYDEGEGIFYTIDDVTYDLTEFFSDERRYPVFENDTEGKLGVMQDFGDKNDSVVNMWERVKGGDEFPWQLIVAIAVSIAAVAGVFGIAALVRTLKSKRRPHVETQDELLRT